MVNRWFYWPFLLDIYIHLCRCWCICTRATRTMSVFSHLSILLYIEHTLGVLFSRWSGLFLIWNVLIYFECKFSNKNLRCLLLKIWPLEICWSTVFLLFTKYIRRLLRLDLVFQLLYCFSISFLKILEHNYSRKGMFELPHLGNSQVIILYKILYIVFIANFL